MSNKKIRVSQSQNPKADLAIELHKIELPSSWMSVNWAVIQLNGSDVQMKFGQIIEPNDQPVNVLIVEAPAAQISKIAPKNNPPMGPKMDEIQGEGVRVVFNEDAKPLDPANTRYERSNLIQVSINKHDGEMLFYRMSLSISGAIEKGVLTATNTDKMLKLGYVRPVVGISMHPSILMGLLKKIDTIV